MAFGWYPIIVSSEGVTPFSIVSILTLSTQTHISETCGSPLTVEEPFRTSGQATLGI